MESYDGVFEYSKEMRKRLDEQAELISRQPHKPSLKIIDDGKTKKFLVEEKDGKFATTNEVVKAKKTGDFCYIEEEIYFRVKEQCKKNGLELKTSEIDTKILKAMFPEKDFDAYSFDSPGMGLNIDGLTRISGRLYKIKP